MVIAKPFARVAVVVGEEIRVPPDADRAALAATWARAVADGLRAAESEARGLLHAGR